MKNQWHSLLWAGGLLFLFTIPVAIATADDQQSVTTKSRPHPPVGIYLDLSEDFYQALKESNQGGTRTLSTGMSEDYLHQIAIATRYTVETNLQILKQQERIIQLLESLQSKPGGAKR